MRSAKLAAVAAAMGGVLLTVLMAPPAGAQAQAWVRQFGTGDNDRARAIAPDGVGGVYVAGRTEGSLGGPGAGEEDAWVARYDAAGNQTWIRQLGTGTSEWVGAVAPDGAGGVFVTGFTRGSLGGPGAGLWDAWVAHYDSIGNQTWVRQLGSSLNDHASAAASDGAGGVYLSGFTGGDLGGPSAGRDDAWIARYDGAGNQTWLRQFGTSSLDEATAAASDGAGGVYVTGLTFGSLGGPNAGSWDVWIARYDGAGNQTWIRQFGTGNTEAALAAASDGEGGVYLGGYTTGGLGGPFVGFRDAWVARYDSMGNQAWIEQLGTTGDEEAYAVALDGAGGVYVGGSTNGSLGGPSAGATDAWLARFDGMGDRIWIGQLGTRTFESLEGVAPDGVGGVYLTGPTTGSLGGPNAGANDAWLAHYERLNPIRYCTPAIPNSTGQSGVLTVTGSGQVMVNDVTVTASQLPTNAFGFFLTSRDQGSSFPISNSQGRICLGGSIGRYVGMGQIQNSGSSGSFSLTLDLTAMAQPQGSVAVQPGEAWNFQAWHRDANPVLTSNFTDAVSVTFR